MSDAPYLAPHHREMLEKGSWISRTLIADRGCFTAKTKEELRRVGFSVSQSDAFPALVLPSWNIDRQISYYQMRPDNPRMNEKGKPRKYEIPAGSRMRLDIPPSPALWEALKNPSEPLWITEGIKKGDCLWSHAGLCVVTLLGVSAHRGKNKYGGICDLADWSAIPLNGRTIYIVFDNDVMFKKEVRRELRALTKMLKNKGASEVIPIVPSLPGMAEGEKLGVDDFYARGGQTAHLKNECCAPELLGKSLPDIVYSGGRHITEIYDDTLNAVVEANNPPFLFTMGGALVEINHRYEFDHLDLLGMRATCSEVARWVALKKNREGETERCPMSICPKDASDYFFKRASREPVIPEVDGVSACPILSPDFEMCSDFGYSPESKYFIKSNVEWPAWDGDSRSAADFLLDDVLVDFPFVDNASRAHALCLMLLPMVRLAISGPTPLHVITAPQRSSGKSKLANILLRCTQGDHISTGTTPKADDESEWRKEILSKLRAGFPYMFFDDIDRPLNSGVLNAAITAGVMDGRLLGGNSIGAYKNLAAWVITANNIKLSPDLSERSLGIRINPQMSDPTKRTGFKHDPIEQYVSENRVKIISALMCIVATWARDRKPYTGLRHGRFVEWSNVLGGILESCGVTGFMENFDETREAQDVESIPLQSFVTEWYKRWPDIPIRATELVDCWDPSEPLGKGDNPSLHSKSVALGKKLRDARDQVFTIHTPIGPADARLEYWNEHNANCYKLVTLRGADVKPEGGIETTPPSGLNLTGGCDNALPPVDLGSKGGVGDVGGVNSTHAHTYAHTRMNTAGKTSPTSPTPPTSPPDDETIEEEIVITDE